MALLLCWKLEGLHWWILDLGVINWRYLCAKGVLNCRCLCTKKLTLLTMTDHTPSHKHTFWGGNMHDTCIEYTSAMHEICLYHAQNYAWYMHEDLCACFRPVSCQPSVCKMSQFLVCSSTESYPHYALQNQATAIQDIMWDLAHGMCWNVPETCMFEIHHFE